MLPAALRVRLLAVIVVFELFSVVLMAPSCAVRVRLVPESESGEVIEILPVVWERERLRNVPEREKKVETSVG